MRLDGEKRLEVKVVKNRHDRVVKNQNAEGYRKEEAHGIRYSGTCFCFVITLKTLLLACKSCFSV